MKECWRWFGPLDAIPLREVAQTGATGVVTALHEIPYGEVWGMEAIRARQALISGDASLGLDWHVVESLPVHEDIKRGTGDLARLFANYRQLLANLAPVASGRSATTSCRYSTGSVPTMIRRCAVADGR